MPRNDLSSADPSLNEVDTSRMTDRARGILDLAKLQAVRRSDSQVGPEHLLIAMAMEAGGVAGNVLRFLGANADRIEEAIPQSRNQTCPVPETPPWSQESLRCIARAYDERVPLGHNYVGTEHLILGVVLCGEGRIPKMLSHLNLAACDIRDEVYQLLGHQP